jgi:hypothetical protein
MVAGLGSTQRQARELISGPCLGTKARFLSFNRTQTRVVTGLLTGHNTLRRHVYLMGLLDIPLCRRCGAENESLAHIVCECEALASLRHAHLGSFFLDPEDIKNKSGGHLELRQSNRAPMNRNWAQRAHQLRPRYTRASRPLIQMQIN